MAEAAVILGIDPGSHHLGWAMVAASGRQVRHLDSGVLDAPAGPLAARLYFLAVALGALIAQWQPHCAAVEAVFAGQNAKSALMLGHARGAILLTLAQVQVPIFEYAATAIKQAACGSGRADKAQVAAMMRLLLALPQLPRPDQGDALAAAWCHAAARPFITHMQRAQP